MTRTPPPTVGRPSAVSLRHLTVIALTVLLALHLGSASSFAQQAPVGLGTADSFAVLAGSTITNTGSTTITGDVGLHPGTAVTGFESVTLEGELHVDDAVAEQAKVDLVTAYDVAAGSLPVTTVATELGGQELTGGVYDSADGTFQITGTLTLDAEGDPETVWVFQTASTLVTASDSDVNLVNGADACNVYWQVGSNATLGTSSALTGTVMALNAITLTTGASVQGRVLARNGAVTMDTNVITNAACTTPDAVDDTPEEPAPVDDTPVDDTPEEQAPVDDTPTDTPVEGDAPTGDDSSSGAGTPRDNGTPTDDGTTSQVTQVPDGPVAAGGGGTDGPIRAPLSLVAGALMLLVAASAVGANARRRARP